MSLFAFLPHRIIDTKIIIAYYVFSENFTMIYLHIGNESPGVLIFENITVYAFTMLLRSYVLKSCVGNVLTNYMLISMPMILCGKKAKFFNPE